MNELYYRKKYDVATMTDEQLKRLEYAENNSSTAPNKIIEGGQTYRIVELPDYMLEFQFVPATQE